MTGCVYAPAARTSHCHFCHYPREVTREANCLACALHAISCDGAAHVQLTLQALKFNVSLRLQLSTFDIAEKCLQTYLLEARKYAAGLQKLEVKDQYMCRALYALAAVITHKASVLKGKPLVNGILEAIKHIMAGLDIALSSPRYMSLVYNGSVQYWHTSRTLQRDKMRSHLLPSQEAICNALDEVSRVQGFLKIPHHSRLALGTLLRRWKGNQRGWGPLALCSHTVECTWHVESYCSRSPVDIASDWDTGSMPCHAQT